MRLKNMTTKELAKNAAEAHTNLVMYHAIISLCESGCFHGPTSDSVQKIIALSKSATRKELAKYDSFMDALKLAGEP
jgi:uncharacterized protein YcsI (UPF0317 family)